MLKARVIFDDKKFLTTLSSGSRKRAQDIIDKHTWRIANTTLVHAQKIVFGGRLTPTLGSFSLRLKRSSFSFGNFTRSASQYGAGAHTGKMMSMLGIERTKRGGKKFYTVKYKKDKETDKYVHRIDQPFKVISGRAVADEPPFTVSIVNEGMQKLFAAWVSQGLAQGIPALGKPIRLYRRRILMRAINETRKKREIIQQQAIDEVIKKVLSD